MGAENAQVGRAGIQRDFDASEDAGSRLGGRVSFAAADIPFDRLKAELPQLISRVIAEHFRGPGLTN